MFCISGYIREEFSRTLDGFSSYVTLDGIAEQLFKKLKYFFPSLRFLLRLKILGISILFHIFIYNY